MTTTSPSATPGPSSLNINASRQLGAWLREQHLSLAFTTYQAGKIFFLGLDPTGKLWVFERSLERPMGLCCHGRSLYLSTLYQLWRFENICPADQRHDNFDALFLPQLSYVTGDLDIHDIAIDAKGQLVFVNTLFSCLATVSESESFVPLWKPCFISRLAAEDRCHLNGLAMRHGRPAYVTTVYRSDVEGGWRNHRHDGGCVVDVESNQIILSNLSMPHSPRWHRGKLWLLNSGRGEFGWLDPAENTFHPVAFCPGYLRGLAMHGNFAVVGLSKPRNSTSFIDLELDERLRNHSASPRCGLMVIDLRSGDCVHSITIEGVVEELYDVAVLPGVQQPSAVGFQSDEIRRVLHVPQGINNVM